MMKVLIAEDDKVSSKVLERNIRNWGYKVIISNNGQQAWNAFQKDEIPLAILDWMMPKIDGLELCQKVRQLKKNNYTYIILLTSKDRKEDILEGFRAGADDYIVKPFDTLELRARLQTGKRIVDLQNQLIQSNLKLEELAREDSMTKLWNRAAIIQLLEDEIHRSQREKKPVGVILVDIDYFKNINDTYGHLVGDAVLIEMTARLKKKIRLYDKIGRYGGDEILVVLPNCGLAEVENVAERLRLAVCKHKIQTDVGSLDVSLSLGAFSSEKQPDITVENLIRASDNALYQAKRSGRNCVIINKYFQILTQNEV